MFTEIIKTLHSDITKRTYNIADTYLGQIIYYQFGKYIQWKNLSNNDLMWSVNPTAEFQNLFNDRSVETFASKRINDWSKEKVKINCGYNKYQLVEKKEPDGYVYEIPSGNLRAFTKKKYPNLKFPYTKYCIKTIKNMSYRQLENAKIKEVIKYNGNDHYDIHVVSAICDAVYKYCKNN